MVIAHAGHWAVQLLYLAPIVAVVGFLGWSVVRDRRETAELGED